MKMRHYYRPVLAQVAAYAVALQAILLVVAGPMAGAAGLFVAPICSHSGVGIPGPAPAGHGCDCIANCLAGCCSTAAGPPAGIAALDAPRSMQTVVAALAIVPILRSGAAVAHRSRAPPLG